MTIVVITRASLAGFGAARRRECRNYLTPYERRRGSARSAQRSLIAGNTNARTAVVVSLQGAMVS